MRQYGSHPVCRRARPIRQPIRAAALKHRLFASITINWRGEPLVSHQVITQLIGSTTPGKSQGLLRDRRQSLSQGSQGHQPGDPGDQRLSQRIPRRTELRHGTQPVTTLEQLFLGVS
jgi:hypothetical protein